MITKEQAQKIVGKILSMTKADAVRISISGSRSSNLRFALNSASTSGGSQNTSISVTTTFGKRSGSASANQTDDKTLAATVRAAEVLARLAPEDAEYMPPVGPQEYAPVNAYIEETANVSPEFRARVAEECIHLAKERKLTSAGFIETAANQSFYANNKGLFAEHRSSNIGYSTTARSEDGTGSGWGGGGHTDVGKLDSSLISRRSIEKAEKSIHPVELAPGKYTVVLEPEAVRNLLGGFIFRMDARSADEGRSFYSEVGGKNKIGQQIFPAFVNISSDPASLNAPAFPWGEDGLPTKKMSWIENGVLKNLRYSRYWAQKQGTEPNVGPANVIMQGGTGSIADLIAATERGILVTRFWYIREVDPRTVLLTGLTRDGTFLIENGNITSPVKNFRFNESPIAMLKNTEMMSTQFRMQNGGSADLLPALKVKDFTFSSLSDAV